MPLTIFEHDIDKGTTRRLVHGCLLCCIVIAMVSCMVYQITNSRNFVIQNSTARPVTGTTQKWVSKSPILRDLHWLPIRSRIEFSILLLTYFLTYVLYEMAPSYLSELREKYEPMRILRVITEEPMYSTRHFNQLKFYGKRIVSGICCPRTMEQHPKCVP